MGQGNIEVWEMFFKHRFGCRAVEKNMPDVWMFQKEFDKVVGDGVFDAAIQTAVSLRTLDRIPKRDLF